ncbi:amidase domain-containing protein, partial [Clostridium perfringens]|uniref:amidase domain-containing protein n=1 Tax=Clostridium perfringens TaxID=1502 RepID=UPI0032DB2EFC
INENYLSPTQYETLNINGIDINLSKTFVDREDALNNFKNIYSEELEFIKSTLNLEELSLSNYEVYYTTLKSLNDYVNINTVPAKLNKNISELLKFFDIFENNEINQQIKDLNSKLITQNVSSRTISPESNKILNSIDSLLPYDSPSVAPISIQPMAFIGLSVDNAINYATKYATSPNSSFKYFNGNDCTNFVSQILTYGGIPRTSSWYYRTASDYATNWVNANSFARYWGVKYNSTSHYTFSSFIDKGDVIVLDYGDGTWDHVGFVTAADSYSATYSGKTYYDYKVAQHSSNYHAWTSSSTNGWETVENPYAGVKYGVLRK